MASEAAHAGAVITKGLCHVAIRVSDLDRSIRFYTDMFNLKLVERREDMAFLSTIGKNDSLALFKAEGKIPADTGLHHFGFFVDEENFEKALRHIIDNRIKVRRGPGMWQGGGRYVYVEDPDGYEVQISVE